MSFANLRKNRTQSFDALNSELQKMDKKGGGKDDRYWKLDVDKVGNGMAVIRFLPAPDGEDLPFVRVIDHGFQGKGGWYIENSRKTLGNDEPDPVAEMNAELWATGTEENKAKARLSKRRIGYHANIYVVKDPANPANEGKVFLFKFGPEIYKKLSGVMNPEFADETAMNPFDFWEGANFKLKARNKDNGFRTYEPSQFDNPGPLADDDAMEKIYGEEYSLAEIISPANFKSYAELKAKLNRVQGIPGASAPSAPAESAPTQNFEPKFGESKTPSEPVADAPTADASDGDDDMEFFKSISS